MSELFVNDIMDELREDNKRLSNELSFERQLNEILENIRKYSLVLINSCKCDSNPDLKQTINQFNTDFDVLKLAKDMVKDSEEVIESNANNVFNSVNFTESNVNKKSKTSDNSRTNTTSIGLTTEAVLPICGGPEEELQINDNNVFDENFVFYSDQMRPRIVSKNRKSISGQSKTKRVRPKKKSMTNRKTICVSYLEEMADMANTSRLMSSKESQNNSLKCNECKKCFTSEMCLEKHFNRVHKKSKDYVCEHCSQRFYANHSLLYHLSEEHRIRCYGCDSCDYKSARKHHIRRHQQSIHSSAKPFVCDVIGCDLAFKRTDGLSKHKRLVH